MVDINRVSSGECGSPDAQLLSDNLIMADRRLILGGDSIKTDPYSGRQRQVVIVEEFSCQKVGNEFVMVGNGGRSLPCLIAFSSRLHAVACGALGKAEPAVLYNKNRTE